MRDPRTLASDADRDRTADRLREAHAEGRLTTEELEDRVGRVYAARTVGDLRAVRRDVPTSRAERRYRWLRARRWAFRAHAGTYAVVNTGLVATWAVDGGAFWPAFPLAGWGALLAYDGWQAYRPRTRRGLPVGAPRPRLRR